MESEEDEKKGEEREKKKEVAHSEVRSKWNLKYWNVKSPTEYGCLKMCHIFFVISF